MRLLDGSNYTTAIGLADTTNAAIGFLEFNDDELKVIYRNINKERVLIFYDAAN